MPEPFQLLKRLDEIGESLSQTHKALALIGLGSVGIETARLDAYSDLDFFAIVKEGYKTEFLHDLTWLSSINPVIWSFQNTSDGYKLLFEDGIFAEFAVFEPLELERIPFATGRVVWAEAGVSLDIARPKIETMVQEVHSTDWLIGEILSNLYIGLGRYHRGEKLSAFRFVQVFAVDRFLELANRLEGGGISVNKLEDESASFNLLKGAGASFDLSKEAQSSLPDPFAGERRFEKRFPGSATVLPKLMLGYARTQESAWNMLSLLEEHFEINQQMRQTILELVR